MKEDDSRSVILARRARFVAAALAGSGIGVNSPHALAQEPTEPAAKTQDQNQPRICLSDDQIEGTERNQPLQVPEERPPEPCLSIEPPLEQKPYFRFGAGPALAHMGAREGTFDESGSGFGVQLDLQAGIWTSNRFGLAFGVTGIYAPSLRNDRLGSGTFWRAGTVLDWFPGEYPGFHASFSAGWMYFGVERDGRGGAHGLGFGGGLWLGYDVPISERWALGPAIGGIAGWGLGLGDERDVRWDARALSIVIGVVKK